MAGFNNKDLLDITGGKELFDFKKIWNIVAVNWYWILISVLICVGVSFVYLKYKSPVYAASMKVLVKDSGQKNRSFAGMGLSLNEMGTMSNTDGFENELEILRSTSLSVNVVKRLKLYQKYYLEGSVKNVELYKTSPIQIDLDDQSIETLNATLQFEVVKTGDSFSVRGYSGALDAEHLIFNEVVKALPAKIPTPYGIVMVSANGGASTGKYEQEIEGVLEGMENGRTLYVVINSPQIVGRMYAAGMLSASATAKTTTVADVRVVDTNADRALDYLRELFACYNDAANEDKNEVARKTEEFISDRLEDIRIELDQTEGQIESYKKGNKLINLANDATTALTSSSEYKKRLLDAETQVTVLKSLIEYMDNPENYLQIIPANVGLDGSSIGASLGEIIAEYNDCVLKRTRYLKGSSEENPMVVRVTAEIETLWPTVRQNMESVLRNAELRKKTIEDEYKYMTGRIANTPTQERVLTGILRQQTLQSELYLTLLQKREENFIQLYSTVAKGRLIDMPVITGTIGPKGSTIILVGFLVGLILPIVLFLGMDLLRIHIAGRKDVEELTNLPILADIPLAKNLDMKRDERAVVVRENYNDVIEEGFRDLRTNIGFVLKPEEKVIMLTSCIPCEGKTFVASNLAMSLALLGKKVIVVGCDLRKPRLVALFGLKPTNQGIVNFLCTSEPDYGLLDSQIISSGVHKNMDVLPAGIIPPNPAELLSGALLEEAIAYLSSKYDYVILDTPPVGLVSDTLSIGRLANLTIFVTRTDFTPKANFDLINSISKSGKLPKCNIVINGVDFNKRRCAQQYGHYGHYRHYASYGNYASRSHDVRTEK